MATVLKRRSYNDLLKAFHLDMGLYTVHWLRQHIEEWDGLGQRVIDTVIPE